MTSKQKAIEHIRAALDTGVRGEVREYLSKALKAAERRRAAGLTSNDYNHLAIGAKLMDPDRPGLVMRHGKRTGKVWMYRRKVNGTVTETQFGSFPDLSVADARTTWGEMREAERTGQSVDVVLQPKERVAGITMGELVHRYLEEYAKPFKRSWEMDKTYLERNVLAHYATLPATQFTADIVRSILAPISERTPREAEKIRGVLSSMFNVGRRGSKKLGNLSGSTWLPPDTPNPAEAVILPERETKRHTPTENEMQILMRALDDEGDIGDAIRLQALTCARVSEVAALPFDEIDVNAGVWRLPADRSKNGKAHNVMLPRQALALLERRRAETNGAYVFPGAKSAPHITRNTIGKAFNRIHARTELPEAFTSHTLRHGCLTWLAEQGATKDIRDRVSNHSSTDGSADSVYNAAQLNQPAREWLQRWADHLTGLEADNVVRMAQ